VVVTVKHFIEARQRILNLEIQRNVFTALGT